MLTNRFLHFAHQGGGLLAPENTLEAFTLGASYAPDALELDIQMTRDGEIVVIHDPTVDRTTNGHGPVADFTLAELQALDAGYHFTPDDGRTYPFRGRGIIIPTLREVFGRFPSLLINIDLKEEQPGKEAALWRTIQQAQATDRVIVASFECASLRRFRQLAHDAVPTSACPDEVRTFVICQQARVSRWLRHAYQALQVPETHGRTRIVSPASVRAAHRLGIAVHVWTINERADMERLLDWGVDGLMTDRPDLLAEVLRSRGLA
ncbi:MAG TPA: glycerophosphodiester phosphodiesterase [Ktedonobacterales bacterium]|nr:glycerophosphodiester phosphodiesterase [Ktedonobacterales bacterium]